MLEKKKSFSIFMPKPTEHNSKNQDPHSNQVHLSIETWKKYNPVKMLKKIISVTVTKSVKI